MRLIACEKRKDGFHYKLTVEFSPFWPWGRPQRQRFVGEGTVWHEYPGGKRCSSFLEGDLCDMLQGWKFRNEKDTP